MVEVACNSEIFLYNPVVHLLSLKNVYSDQKCTFIERLTPIFSFLWYVSWFPILLTESLSHIITSRIAGLSLGNNHVVDVWIPNVMVNLYYRVS